MGGGCRKVLSGYSKHTEYFSPEQSLHQIVHEKYVYLKLPSMSNYFRPLNINSATII